MGGVPDDDPTGTLPQGCEGVFELGDHPFCHASFRLQALESGRIEGGDDGVIVIPVTKYAIFLETIK